VWFEDAIASYGVPTVVFDLHLLVADIDEAARALMQSGWTDAGPLNSNHHFLMGPISQRRLNPPGHATAVKIAKPRPGPPPLPSKEPPGPTTTVLLPATDWNVPIEQLRPNGLNTFVPPLALLVDALIDSLLDTPSDTVLKRRLATYIGYLYRYCASLKAQDFAENLKADHRQFHYDKLSRPHSGTIPFFEEQRLIRDAIREGKQKPQRNAWYLGRGEESTHREPKDTDVGEPTPIASPVVALGVGLETPNGTSPATDKVPAPVDPCAIRPKTLGGNENPMAEEPVSI
jgi:hypothetical protein